MTYRERILAALRGQPVDFIPFAPRIFTYRIEILQFHMDILYQSLRPSSNTKDIHHELSSFSLSIHLKALKFSMGSPATSWGRRV